jgi:hypothetical protein
VPPEQKPEGSNVEWIPGYWAWEDERNDFLWVSGIWRAVPPGRQWVPGYWRSAALGSQWTSGYWANAEIGEIEYLPEPPQSLEAGPNVDAPSADHAWVPGCWVWHHTRYAWRPGYWAMGHPNWIWVPARYVWAPRGYVFIDGYYDHLVARRGVLFAPVIFNPTLYARRDFYYSPATVINLAVFTNHLFVRPRYCHYYFGDYYDSHYVAGGFTPWFSFHSSRHGYDPFYAYERRRHRHDREWDRQVATEFAHRRDHQEARPPRTWADQRSRSGRDATTTDSSVLIAASLDELAKNRDIPIRLKPVATEERQSITQRKQEVRVARDVRRKTETESLDPREAPVPPSKPVKAKLPKTSIVARPADGAGKGDVPPRAIEAPPPDTSVEPVARQAKRSTNVEPSADLRSKVREPRRELPDANPKPEQPKARPKGPVAEPQPVPPDAAPKTERPKATPKGPETEPRPLDTAPKTERTKPLPKGPVVEPRPELPDAAPKTERPKSSPKGPADDPRPERSKKPKAKSDAPSSADPKLAPAELRTDRPKTTAKSSKADPGAEQPGKTKKNQKPKRDEPKAKEGEPDDKSKVDPKEVPKVEKDKAPK